MPDNVSVVEGLAHSHETIPLKQLANLVIFVVNFATTPPKLFISLKKPLLILDVVPHFSKIMTDSGYLCRNR